MNRPKKYIGPKIKSIPAGWTVEPLGHCIKGSGKYGINEPASDFKETLPRYLRITDVNDSGFLKHDDKKSVAADNYEKYLLDEGDIVFARTGNTVGKSYLYKKDDGVLVYAGYLIKFTPDPTILKAKYLKYYTESGFFWNWIGAISQRSGQPGVNSTEYKKMPLLLPTIDEQETIIATIREWDEAILKLQLLIQAKKRYKKGLMQQLLSGKNRFPEFEGEDWQEFELNKFFKYYSNKNKEDEDLPIMSCSKVHGITKQENIFDKRIASEDVSGYKIIEKDDLVYDPMLLWDASIGFVKEVERGVISPAYYTFKFKEGSAYRPFFEFVFGTHYMKYNYKAISQGTNTRRRKAPREAFLKIPIKIPKSIEEQKKIADTLLAAQKEIDLLEEEVKLIQKQKKGLMQQLLTGKVRVNHKEADYAV